MPPCNPNSKKNEANANRQQKVDLPKCAPRNGPLGDSRLLFNALSMRIMGELFGRLKGGHVRARGNINAEFAGVVRVLIVASQALAKFCCGDTDDGLDVCIEIGPPLEDLNPDDPLFQSILMPRQTLLNDISQELAQALSILEEWIGENALQLLPNSNRSDLRFY